MRQIKAVAVHAPGIAHDKDNILWQKINHFIENKKFTLIDKQLNVELITYNSLDSKGLFEKSLDKFNLPYYVVGKGVEKWTNLYKMEFVIKLIKELTCEFIIVGDSLDVAFIKNPYLIINALDHYKCKLLFNGEKFFWPDFGGILTSFRDFQKEKANGRPNAFLNAGLWAGERVFCIEFLEYCRNLVLDLPKVKTHDLTQSDQCLCHASFPYFYPQVNIDTNAIAFQNTAFYTEKELITKSIKLI